MGVNPSCDCPLVDEWVDTNASSFTTDNWGGAGERPSRLTKDWIDTEVNPNCELIADNWCGGIDANLSTANDCNPKKEKMAKLCCIKFIFIISGLR